MNIKQAEELTGLPRSSIRFYEKEKLVVPAREKSNGYRDYSDVDIENIKKIAFLRTLGISIEDIRGLMEENITLQEAIQKQEPILAQQITELRQAKALCEKMLQTAPVSYQELQVEQYAGGLQDYWKDNPSVFRLDCVSFIYLWGSLATWVILTGLCLLTALLFYTKLPPEIPVQWSGGEAVSLVNKNFIFAYPVVCVAVRFLLRPCIYAKLQNYAIHTEIIAEYLTNYLCFLALSTELFSILFVYGLVKNIVTVLAVDTAALLGLLVMGYCKWKRGS